MQPIGLVKALLVSLVRKNEKEVNVLSYFIKQELHLKNNSSPRACIGASPLTGSLSCVRPNQCYQISSSRPALGAQHPPAGPTSHFQFNRSNQPINSLQAFPTHTLVSAFSTSGRCPRSPRTSAGRTSGIYLCRRSLSIYR